MKKLTKTIKIIGTVIPGKKLGQKIGFPTANLKLAKPLSIKTGVYLAITEFNHQSYLSLAYFGPKYIQSPSKNSFEVFLFNFNQDIYHKKPIVKLTHFIRSPKKLDSVIKIKTQLTKDVQAIVKNNLVLVNQQNQITGVTNVLQAHQNPPQLHRAVSIILFNSQGELLVQKRSQYKPLWPLFWSNTCCTHPRPGEIALQTAQRRLFEEMGIKTKLKFFYQLTYKAKYNQKLSEYEIDSIFLGISDKKPKLNRKEAADYQYMSLTQLKKDIKINPKKYTPWFKLILKRLKSSDILTS